MYQPNLIINYGAIALSTVVYFLIGWIWYGVFFMKPWAREMKMPPDYKPTAREMVKSTVLMVFGAFLTSFVLTHASQVWRPSVWGVTGAADSPAWMYGIMASTFTWIGYFLPLHLLSVGYENRSWKFFGINAGYHFVALQAIGQILAYWR